MAPIELRNSYALGPKGPEDNPITHADVLEMCKTYQNGARKPVPSPMTSREHKHHDEFKDYAAKVIDCIVANYDKLYGSHQTAMSAACADDWTGRIIRTIVEDAILQQTYVVFGDPVSWLVWSWVHLVRSLE
ncbi:uncharacterized protein AB675_7883 [Cyphellophora attinorum]|uniref:Uncharacterized protein n=1 Tax=Cyphellophora attinorum TaxID=1664694 RepID=A0A0N1H5U1_9EURO|nr:uncharacterized protein AB675_7883 [Phialophora attinorum]KPI41213.1 hypothetical protein AB675_7883 [Phialophora attinorum]